MSVGSHDKLVGRARALRREMTPWERKLWYTFLKDYPVHIYRQRVMGNYIVDFYCDAAKLAIELDGSQHFTPEQKAYDEERTAFLKGRGIEVLRIPNREVDVHFRQVCDWIDREIGRRRRE